jgi:uncharacterized RmlC-like cupin family protein
MKRSARVTLFFAALFEAQAQQSVPPGSAIDIASAEVQAAVRKTASVDISDQQLRVVSINSEYNVGIGVVNRAKTNGPQAVNGVEHSQITEIYHVISGNATLVTGGALENAQPVPAADPVVKVLNGPSTIGSAILGGVSRQIGPGDIVIIPPNTPHWFSAIATDQIVYLVVRMDPHNVLPAGYDARRVP